MNTGRNIKIVIFGILYTVIMYTIALQMKSSDSLSIVGHWRSNRTAVETVIWEEKGEYKLLEFDTETGTRLKIVCLGKDEEGHLTVVSLYEPTNYVSKATFIPISKDSIEVKVEGTYPETFRAGRVK